MLPFNPLWWVRSERDGFAEEMWRATKRGLISGTVLGVLFIVIPTGVFIWWTLSS